MTTHFKIALHAGYEQCDEKDPAAQLIDGYFYRPKMGKDSLWTVMKALECKSKEEARHIFSVNPAEA